MMIMVSRAERVGCGRIRMVHAKQDMQQVATQKCGRGRRSREQQAQTSANRATGGLPLFFLSQQGPMISNVTTRLLCSGWSLSFSFMCFSIAAYVSLTSRVFFLVVLGFGMRPCYTVSNSTTTIITTKRPSQQKGTTAKHK
jgi:hypothetical protein